MLHSVQKEREKFLIVIETSILMTKPLKGAHSHYILDIYQV